jgi:hypothetical protein
MKRALIALAILLSAPVFPQTVANATPSWDQTLPAAQRFIVLANFNQQAVLDRETGLVWEKSPSLDVAVWDAVRQTCIDKSIGGRKGWRLPSIPEISSLLDTTATTSPSLPTGHPFLNIGPGIFSLFFSATVDASNPSQFVWAITFSTLSSGSHIALTFKAQNFRAWCVRGGMNADAY